jgi:hypothetical protein
MPRRTSHVHDRWHDLQVASTLRAGAALLRARAAVGVSCFAPVRVHSALLAFVRDFVPR